MDGARRFELQRLGVRRDPVARGHHRFEVALAVLSEPAQIARRELESGAALPERREGIAMETLQRSVGERGEIVRKPRLVPPERVGRRNAVEVRPQPLERGINDRAPHDRTRRWQLHHLGIRRQVFRTVQSAREAEQVIEIVSAKLEITRVMEVSEPPCVRVERLNADRAFDVFAPVRRAGRIRKKERIDFDERGATQLELYVDVFEQRVPDVQLDHVYTVQPVEIFKREFEERPLVAFEIHCQRERQCGDRIRAPDVQQFDPQIH